MKRSYGVVAAALLAAVIIFGHVGSVAAGNGPSRHVRRPGTVRGIHITAWVAGDEKRRGEIDRLLDETELNTAVIDIKETTGEVYLPGFTPAEVLGSTVSAMPDIARLLDGYKRKGIYTVARIVVFKDNRAVLRRPDWAVKDATGGIWKDWQNMAWVDPFNRDAREYNLRLAEYAADFGFDEIQFDYVRFPSDGPTDDCRYSRPRSSETAVAAISGFLREARRRLQRKGVVVSADVFGFTTSAADDMGIGQRIEEVARQVDFVCPMLYPSLYRKGEYGLADPEKEPYATVDRGLSDARRILGSQAKKLRPYFQDYSRAVAYGPAEVRAQIHAAYDNGVYEWQLWNENCVYTREGLKDKPPAAAAN